MFKKAIAAIAIAGSLLIVAPRAALADEAPARPVATTEQGTTDPKRDAAARQAISDIEQRLAADPALARQLQAAAEKGDTASAGRLLASEGADVLAIGTTESSGDHEAARVTIRVTVTVCVTVWGTTYCGRITVTVNLD